MTVVRIATTAKAVSNHAEFRMELTTSLTGGVRIRGYSMFISSKPSTSNSSLL